ncbi:hypothetical protein D3C75_1129090 [compost metagenome]
MGNRAIRLCSPVSRQPKIRLGEVRPNIGRNLCPGGSGYEWVDVRIPITTTSVADNRSEWIDRHTSDLFDLPVVLPNLNSLGSYQCRFDRREA